MNYPEQDTHIKTVGRHAVSIYCGGGSVPPEVQIIESYESGGTGGLFLADAPLGNKEDAIVFADKFFTGLKLDEMLPIDAKENRDAVRAATFPAFMETVTGSTLNEAQQDWVQRNDPSLPKPPSKIKKDWGSQAPVLRQ